MSKPENLAGRSRDARLSALDEETARLAAEYKELDEQRAEAARTESGRVAELEREMEAKAGPVWEIVGEIIETPADTTTGVVVKLQALRRLLADVFTVPALVRSIIDDMRRLTAA